jgi:membrane associated rhomboid family serine protease
MADKFSPMSSDRFYLRNDYQRPQTTMLVWLIATIIAAFVIQLVLMSPWLGSAGLLVAKLALTVDGMKDGHVWVLVTHSLLHSTASPFHILFTIIGLIFVGRELEPLLGPRKFLTLYIGAIIFSALCWCGVHWFQGGAHIGAGAAIFAFLVVLSRINPGAEFGLFYLPITFRLQVAIWVMLAAELLTLIFYEIPGGGAPLGLSPSTDLGGMLAGWLFFRFLYANNGWDRAASFAWPGWLRFKGRKPAGTAARTSTAPWRSGNLRADVDRILDKINSHGFHSLSDEEKQILDAAKDLLSKH